MVNRSTNILLRMPRTISTVFLLPMFTTLLSFVAISLFGSAQAAPAASVTTCNVLSYGGVADNKTDVGPAILKAYNDCILAADSTSISSAVLLVPSGNFLLNSNVLIDHASYMTFTVTGNIYLPFNASLEGNMIMFEHSNYILFNGKGAIYGNGYRYREGGDLSLYPSRPRLLRFQDSNYVELTGVTLYDSPMFHVTIIGDNNVAHNMEIIASHIGETDGFDISGNNNYVHDVSVENGDECVTVKTPTNGFVAKNIVCNWTAGCNIGSFGEGTTGVSIKNVTYHNVTLLNSDAGVEVKSYPDASGTIEELYYSDFTITDVAYPISLDFNWCPHTTCPSATGTLTLTNATFDNFSGSGTSSRAGVTVDCLSNGKCTDLTFTEIDITSAKTNTFTNGCGTGLSGLSAC